MNIYDELHRSLQEAVDIKQGKKAASRVTRHEVADVKAIRAHLKISQAEFTKAMGTSVDTIKSWEAKRRNPTGLAAKVLATIQDNPSLFQRNGRALTRRENISVSFVTSRDRAAPDHHYPFRSR